MHSFSVLTAFAAFFIIPWAQGRMPPGVKPFTVPLTGFAAGFITELICFCLLPVSFEGGVYFTLIFVLSGIFAKNFLPARYAKILCLCCAASVLIFLTKPASTGAISAANPALQAVIGFASGVVLSDSCSKIIPDISNRAKFSAVSALIGFIAGIFIS